MASNKLERAYTIPLRSGFIKVPRYYRAKRAINQIRSFVEKHMKTEDVRIGSVLNEHVWSRGIKNPPSKVAVKVVKEDNYVTVELEGHEYKVQKIQTEKTEKPTSFKDKLAAKLKQKEPSGEEVQEQTKPEKKSVEAESANVPDKESLKKEVPVKEESSPKKESVKSESSNKKKADK